jgi:methylase of polypeptide subunit release factors
MSPRRGEYGFDAPYVPALMLLGSTPLWAGALGALSRGDALGTLTMGLSAASLLFCAATFVYATRRGKFEVWDALLDALSLRGDERVLDVGTGGGAPGVILAILRPDLRVELCDSVAKKARAVEAIVAEAGLPIPVHAAAAQALVAGRREGPDRFDTLVVRAVAPLGKLLR